MIEIMPAPLEIRTASSDVRMVVFDNAVVNGEYEGALVVTGAQIKATEGRLLPFGEDTQLSLADTYAWVILQAEETGERPSLGPDAATEHVSALMGFSSVPVVSEDLKVELYGEAYVFTGSETISLTGPITVSAQSLYWGEGSIVYLASVTAHWDGDMLIGVDAYEGDFRVENSMTDQLPLIIMGHDGRLEIGPNHVRTTEAMLVEQALGKDGPLLKSEVEILLCATPPLVLNGRGPVKFAYRQIGAPVPALFVEAGSSMEDVETGETKGSTGLSFESSVPAALADFIEANADTIWVDTLFGGGGGGSGPTATWEEFLVCIVTLFVVCPHDGESSGGGPEPAIGWIEPGQIGEFEMGAPRYSVETRLRDAQLRFEGLNFETVLVPFAIVQPNPDE